MFEQASSPAPSSQSFTSTPAATPVAAPRARRSPARAHRSAFESHVEQTAERLEAWRICLDEHDRLNAARATGVMASDPDRVAWTHAPVFFGFLDDCHAELESLVEELDADEQSRAGEKLRARLLPWLKQSTFLARTIERPRGYAGDAEMMRMIYERAYVGPTSFAKLLHRHPIESDAAQAVRNRRELIPHLLGEVEQRLGSRTDPLRVLSVACGPAWELRDLYRCATDTARFRCTLLDQDAEALETARAGMHAIEQAFGRPVGATFVNRSVKDLLRSAETRASLGRFHFVYSMGLYDYLPANVARALTQHLYDLLEPGGTLVIGNYHVGNPTRSYMKYWMNWPLEYRTEGQLLALAPATEGARASLSFDETRAQMFLRVDRGA